MGFKSSMVSKSASKAGTRVLTNVLTTPLHFLKMSKGDDGLETIVFVLCCTLIWMIGEILYYNIVARSIFISLIVVAFTIWAIRHYVTQKRLKADVASIRSNTKSCSITPTFSDKLRKEHKLEMYFHFTQPLLTKDEFALIHFSDYFTNTFPKYKSYKKAWHKIYWHISLQTKAHKLLKQLIEEDYIPEIQFQQIIKERLSQNLYFGEKRILSKSYSFRKHGDKQIISHRLYWNLWDATKLRNIDTNLRDDYIDRLNKTMEGYLSFSTCDYKYKEMVDEYLAFSTDEKNGL